jgi:hypothetical protein
MSHLSPGLGARCGVVLAATVILASTACNSRSAPAADSGVRQDGGHDHDAGRDAGVDAALAADSGRLDAGSPMDAGKDSGPADAGIDSGAAADSGEVKPDAGNPTPDAGVLRDWPAHTSARVMLSGHSLTDNPIADFVELLAMQHTRSYGWEQQIVIGSPLRYRTRGEDSSSSGFSGYSLGKNRDGNGRNILEELAEPSAIGASERYDTLVVTERHDILASIRGEDTVPYLRHFHDRLREQKSDARTLFYQSWPDIDGDPQQWIDYQAKELVAWECAASKVNLSLERDGAPAAVSVIPVAVALAELLERILAGAVPGVSGLSALFTDDVHPTRLGSYLAAAATYSAVFGTTPVGAPVPENVNPAAAKLALEVAWEVVSNYNRKGATDPSRRSMEDCRTQLTSFCPDYLAIRGLSADCTAWQSADGPMGWPDTSFPLPAS